MRTADIPSAIAALRDQLTAYAPRRGTPALVAITGASGAGKTAVLQRLRELVPALPALSFDSLGVPSDDEMILGWDDGRAWQKAMTCHWVQTAKQVYRTRPLVLLEGSFDPQYAVAACHATRMPLRVVVLDVAAATRRSRLCDRARAARQLRLHGERRRDRAARVLRLRHVGAHAVDLEHARVRCILRVPAEQPALVSGRQLEDLRRHAGERARLIGDQRAADHARELAGNRVERGQLDRQIAGGHGHRAELHIDVATRHHRLRIPP